MRGHGSPDTCGLGYICVWSFETLHSLIHKCRKEVENDDIYSSYDVFIWLTVFHLLKLVVIYLWIGQCICEHHHLQIVIHTFLNFVFI